MRVVNILFIAVLGYAQNFSQIEKLVTNSSAYKLAQKRVQIYQERLKKAESKNYGSVDIDYKAVRFFQRPVLKIEAYQPVAVAPNGLLVYKKIDSQLPVSDNDHYIGEIKYSYPLFTGFAISSLIKKSKLELIREKLKTQNVKRELILKLAELYSKAYALKGKIFALKAAKKALYVSMQKAQAFYKEGLIDKSSYLDIKAKYYDVDSQIKEVASQKEALLNLIGYIVNSKISDVEGIQVKRKTFTARFYNRPDVKVLKETLKISDTDIKIAKSKYYPQIGFEAALKKEADNYKLTRNDYENVNKSYLGIGLKYNLFNGGADKSDIEIAKIAKATSVIYYTDYLNKIKTQFNNDLNLYDSLFKRLKAAKEEIKARESYYDLVLSKFNEGLADGSDVNEAIAKLAESKAKKAAIESQLFFLGIKLEYDSGSKF